jgi:hypothetical protein
VVLEFYLAASKVCLIGLDFAKTAANLRRLLRRHAPVFVKFDRLVRHNRLPFPGLHIPILRSDAPDSLKTIRPSLTSVHPRSALTLAVVGGLQLSNRKNLGCSFTQCGTGAGKIQLKKQLLVPVFFRLVFIRPPPVMAANKTEPLRTIGTGPRD